MEVAFRIYPLPDGKIYTEEDINSLKDVEMLFDYCQIMEAMISRKGWNYPIDRFGMENLYEVEKKSEWFNSESFEEFICDVEYEKERVAYEDEKDHKKITEFCEMTHFSSPLPQSHQKE